MYQIEDIESLRRMSPQQILEWAWNSFGKDAVFTSSFGAEDMAIMDMISRGGLGIEVATLDTGRLHQETYELMDRASARYGIEVRASFPEREKVEEMVASHGINLFYNSPGERKMCCHIRKVEPLNMLLNGKKAWITGLRADQTTTRQNSDVVEMDDERGIVKINPLLKWTSGDVWDYIRNNAVPYNQLHDRGYPSIGCAPCTRAIRKGEDERAGRWWWESDVKECGLHVQGNGKSTNDAPEPRLNRGGGGQ